MVSLWRMVRTRAFVSLCGLLTLLTIGWLAIKPMEKENSGEEDQLVFSQDISGIVSKFCFECHGVEHQEAGLDLRTVASILKGGESGPAMVPGHPEESLLLDMIHDEHMPPEGELLTESDVALVRRWIATGARP